MELTLKEIEVQKLSVQPGDVIIATVKGEYFEENSEAADQLRQALAEAFKDKQVKVVVMQLPDDHDVKFSITQSQPLSYCSDCSCGKKPIE